MKRIAALDPATYKRHLIHGENRTWAETNCYSDVVIELLHGLGHEPIAALAFTFTIDFECDQWTFFKFPDADLLDLYGLDIQELAVWRPLVDHISEQVAVGILTGGTIKIGAVMTKGGAAMATRLAARRVLPVVVRLQFVKKWAASVAISIEMKVAVERGLIEKVTRAHPACRTWHALGGTGGRGDVVAVVVT